MKTKITLLVLCGFFIFSCSNRDYAYNEFVSARYYSLSDTFEDIYKKFESGKYETNYEWKSELSKNQLLTDTRNLRDNAALDLEAINRIDRSEEADKMHEQVSLFFKTVSGDFVDALNAYAEIDCDCQDKKDSVSNIIKAKYKEISAIEDKMLEEQKLWFEKAGFRGEERK